jgi:hypothetical protein
MKYELRLTNGLAVTVDSSLNERNFRNELANGVWLKDKYGWFVNPAHVIFFRLEESDSE